MPLPLFVLCMPAACIDKGNIFGVPTSLMGPDVVVCEGDMPESCLKSDFGGNGFTADPYCGAESPPRTTCDARGLFPPSTLALGGGWTGRFLPDPEPEPRVGEELSGEDFSEGPFGILIGLVGSEGGREGLREPLRGD